MTTIIRKLKNKIYYFLATFIILSLSTETLHPVCSSDVDLDGNVIVNVNKLVFGHPPLNEWIYRRLSNCAGREPTASEINRVANPLWLYEGAYIRLCASATDGVISSYAQGKSQNQLNSNWNSINACGNDCDAGDWGLPTSSTGSNAWSQSWVYWDNSNSNRIGWCRIDYTGSTSRPCPQIASNRFGLPAMIGIVVNQ